MYLDTNLKIFRIDDGEEHHIVAKTKEDAINYFMENLNFEDIKRCCLQIFEVDKDGDIQINLSSDDDLLLALINRYRNEKDKIETINIWDLLKYNLISCKLQDREIEIPYAICSSTFC